MPRNSSELLAAYFPTAPIGSSAPPRRYTDTDIEEIATLLEDHEKQWSSVPRTYIVLRTIGHLDLLNKLIQVGFTDHCFPVKASVLPPRLQPSVRNAIVQAQSIILTKSVDLEKGEYGKHCHFAKGEPQPFKVIGLLGSGGYSQVHRIRSTISFKEYALKRVRRRRAFGNNSKESVRQFTAEMKLLKSLSHRHMMEYVGSYTDPSNLGIVMAPVADKNLAEYLEAVSVQQENLRNNELVTLRSFFGCLASALQYLHDRSICHGDIKPENVLVDGGNVLFTDFGLSKQYTGSPGSATSGITNTTPRYAALEVLAGDARNASADVWSLGCVFLEMVLVLKEKDVSFLKAYFLRNGTKEPYASRNPEAVEKLLRELRFLGKTFDNILLDLMTDMLKEDRFSRPKAAEALVILSTPSFDDSAVRFCGLCCLGDEVSDSHDSLCEDLCVPVEVDPSPFEEDFVEVSTDTIQAATDDPPAPKTFGNQPSKSQPPESQSPGIPSPLNEPSKSQPIESPPLETHFPDRESFESGPFNSYSFESPSISEESFDGAQVETSGEEGGPVEVNTFQIPSDYPKNHMEDESGPSVGDSAKPAEKVSVEQPRARHFAGPAEIPDSDLESDVDRAEIKNSADNRSSMFEMPENLDRPAEELHHAEMNVSSMRLLLEREALAVFGVAAAVNLKQQPYEAGSQQNGTGQQEEFRQREDFGQQDVYQQNNLNRPDSMDQRDQVEQQQDELEQQNEMFQKCGTDRQYEINQQYKQDQQDGVSQQGEVDQQEMSNRNLYKFLPFNSSTGPPSLSMSQDGSLPPDSPPRTSSLITRLFKSENNDGRKPKLSKRLTKLLRRPLSRNKGPESPQSRSCPIHIGQANRKGIFGVGLEDTIKYAGVPVGIFDENDQAYIFGSVPLVVVQCGVFLKEKALEVKEIFATDADEAVNFDLCAEFNTSPQYGKDIDWSKYTVNDAARILIYYLEWLPEPVIPPQLYNRFTQLVHDETFIASFAAGEALPDAEFWIEHYRELIQELSLANARLLLYLLDVLAVFTSDSGINRMNFERLAKLFTGSLLKGLQLDTDDVKSYLVLVFLIVNSDKFLLSGFVESNWRSYQRG